MKQLITLITFILISICAHAQSDVTKFLGIPVDGSKKEMIRNLKSKGFNTIPYEDDVLKGVFNGTNVNVHVITNGDKVCRIMVCDENPIDERSIQIRFNKLHDQFKNNPNYIAFEDNTISDDEDISYGLNIDNKRYEAVFYQIPAEFNDTMAISEKIAPILISKYSTEQLQNPTEEIRQDIINITTTYMTYLCTKKPVWYMISERYGKYSIIMFYDNEYNRANGEDL